MRIPPLDTFRLDGKTALVTGGAGILGRGFAEGLASAGAKVAIVDMQEQAAAGVAAAPMPPALPATCPTRYRLRPVLTRCGSASGALTYCITTRRPRPRTRGSFLRRSTNTPSKYGVR